MSDRTFREIVSVVGRNIVPDHRSAPVADRDAVEAGDALFRFDVFDAAFRPENHNKAQGPGLRLFDAGTVEVELSERGEEYMGGRRRNIDFREIVFRARVALRRKSEIGAATVRAGEMIPTRGGMSRRSMLRDESAEENILRQLRIVDEITFGGAARN